MKKFLLVALLLYATGALAQKVKLYSAGRVAYECNVEQLDSIVFNKEDTPDVGVEHEWVDLGLPSGTLWATCNVGASSPEEYGDYFAWGETEPKDEYNWNTYKWMNAGQSSWEQINKYTFADGQTDACWYDGNGNFIGDNKKEFVPEDDAATANWGSGWQMPSFDQVNELTNVNYTMTEWTTQNGVNGKKVTSVINGNSIFLPAAGYRDFRDLNVAGLDGGYWLRSLTPYSDHVYFLNISLGIFDTFVDYRYFGRSVRPVRVKN